MHIVMLWKLVGTYREIMLVLFSQKVGHQILFKGHSYYAINQNTCIVCLIQGMKFQV